MDIALNFLMFALKKLSMGEKKYPMGIDKVRFEQTFHFAGLPRIEPNTNDF
jgi:hypothetical protein